MRLTDGNLIVPHGSLRLGRANVATQGDLRVNGDVQLGASVNNSVQVKGGVLGPEGKQNTGRLLSAQ